MNDVKGTSVAGILLERVNVIDTFQCIDQLSHCTFGTECCKFAITGLGDLLLQLEEEIQR